MMKMICAILMGLVAFSAASWPGGKSPSCDDTGVAEWCTWCNDMVELEAGAEKVKNPYSGTAQWMTPTGELDVHVCEGAGQNTCLPIAVRCDGEPDCPNGDDEQFCSHHASNMRQRRYDGVAAAVPSFPAGRSESSASGSGSEPEPKAVPDGILVTLATFEVPGVESCDDLSDDDIEAVGQDLADAAVAADTSGATLYNQVATCVDGTTEADRKRRQAVGDVTIEVELWFRVDVDDAGSVDEAVAEAELAIRELVDDLTDELEITIEVGDNTVTATIVKWAVGNVAAADVEAEFKSGAESLLGKADWTYSSVCACSSNSGKHGRKHGSSKSKKSKSSDDAEAKMADVGEADVGEAKMAESSSSKSSKSKKSKSKSSDYAEVMRLRRSKSSKKSKSKDDAEAKMADVGEADVGEAKMAESSSKTSKSKKSKSSDDAEASKSKKSKKSKNSSSGEDRWGINVCSCESSSKTSKSKKSKKSKDSSSDDAVASSMMATLSTTQKSSFILAGVAGAVAIVGAAVVKARRVKVIDVDSEESPLIAPADTRLV